MSTEKREESMCREGRCDKSGLTWIRTGCKFVFVGSKHADRVLKNKKKCLSVLEILLKMLE